MCLDDRPSLRFSALGSRVRGRLSPCRGTARAPCPAGRPARYAGPGSRSSSGSAATIAMASSRAAAMTSSSSMTASIRSEERTPDWAWPSTSPSRRCSRSMRDSSKPSRVAATAPSRARAGAASGISVTSRHRPGRRAPADPAAELVQLGDAEPVGVHDHHGGGVGDVHADLDDGGGDQDVHLARGEAAHHVVLVVGRASGRAAPRPAARAAGPRRAARRCPARPAAGASRPRPPAAFSPSSARPRRRRCGGTPRTPGGRPRPPRAPAPRRGPGSAACPRRGPRGWRSASGRPAAGPGRRSPGRRRRSWRPCAESGWRS